MTDILGWGVPAACIKYYAEQNIYNSLGYL